MIALNIYETNVHMCVKDRNHKKVQDDEIFSGQFAVFWRFWHMVFTAKLVN